jgi:hypothetical protein
VLLETFGPRVIGLQIGRHGDGMTFERRPVKQGSMLVYNVGRTHLFDLLHTAMQSGEVKLVDGPDSLRTYEQLADLEVEMRQTGVVYACPPGKHDDLAISSAMLVWAGRHPHLSSWIGALQAARRPRKPRPKVGWGAWT